MRQGDIVEIVPDNELTFEPYTLHWLVITHCCDLARDDEPVELLPCHLINEVNGTYTKGKNSRRLHFKVHENCFEVYACEKCQVQPEFKSKTKVVYKAEDSFRRTLQNWLASRYRRQALDDKEHTDLINIMRLNKIAQSTEDDLVGIWVNLDSERQETEEGDFNQMYTYELYFVFEAHADFIKHQNLIERKLFSILEKNKTVHKNSIIPYFLSIDDFSLREARQFTFLNFDYLSTDWPAHPYQGNSKY